MRNEKDIFAYNQKKKAVKISRSYDEERRLREFNTDRTYLKQEGQKVTANSAPNVLA